MTDDIRSMSAALAADPGNLVFHELGEALRRRGQLDAALKVATAGATRHPGLADARDLCARIHSDLGDGESAFDAWLEALKSPFWIGFHVVTLLLVVYHAWTWFKVMPKTLPRVPLSDNGIVAAGMGAVALVTLVLLWIA